MSAMKQYQIDVQQAVSQEVADMFRNAARMENTERMLYDFFAAHGWYFNTQTSGVWSVQQTNGVNGPMFDTWEQCLAFLLEQVNGFALVDSDGAVVGVGENE